MKTTTMAVLVTLVPGVLFAQSQGQQQGQQQGQTAGQQSQQSGQSQQAQQQQADARIAAAIHAAAEAKIPTSLLESKVAEGKAKNVSSDKVATAVEARLKSLVRASATLTKADASTSSASELSVAADALEAGVSENALIKVEKSTPADRRVVAVAVMTDLVRLGKSSDAAMTQVTTAAASSTSLANLSAQVASQLRLGGLTSTLDAAGLVKLH